VPLTWGNLPVKHLSGSACFCYTDRPFRTRIGARPLRGAFYGAGTLSGLEGIILAARR
jgi:hypothetical protein